MSGIECALFGTVSRDAEAKTSKGGRQYLRFSCRVGDRDAAQWVSVTAFDPEALARAEKFVKGARVYVEGSIKLDEYSGKDGVMHHGLSCLSWHCRLSAIGRNKPPRPAADSPQRAMAHDDQVPW